MSEYSIDTRLIGAEDLLLDENGTDTQTSYTDPDGISHPLTSLNAKHVPVTKDVRPLVGQAENVNEAIADLAEQIKDVAQQQATAMTEDTVIDLTSPDGRQTLIDAQLKNLGGYTLTFRFPDGVPVQVVSQPLLFTGFYNGTLIVDLNGGSISDNGALENGSVLRFVNCKSAVRIVKNLRNPTQGEGVISFTSNPYGIALVHVTDCEIENIAFSGTNEATCYAILASVSNASFVDCSFLHTKRASSNTIEKDYTDAHATSETAHSELFEEKADVVHSHAISDVSGLENALDALDTGKADAAHTHAITDVTNLQTELNGKSDTDHGHNIGGSNYQEIAFSNVEDAIKNIGFLFSGAQASTFPSGTSFDQYPVGYEDSSGNQNKGWMFLPFYVKDPESYDSNLIPIVVEWGKTNIDWDQFTPKGKDSVHTQNIPVPIRQVFYVGLTGANDSGTNNQLSQYAQFVKMTSKTSFQFYNQNVGEYNEESQYYWFLIGVYGGSFSSLPFSYPPPSA